MPSDPPTRAQVAEYVERLRVFHVHATVFAVSMVGIFVVNLLTNLAAGTASHWWAWWSGWVLLGWGAGIAVHGLVVRVSHPIRNATRWSERKVDEIMADLDTLHDD